MSGLQLFRVEILQTWYAEGEALVLAEKKDDAERAARREVEFDFCDAEEDDTAAIAWPETLDAVDSLTEAKADDLWLLIPDAKHPTRFDGVTLAEFRQAIDPEHLAALALKRKEANNGQLPLIP